MDAVAFIDPSAYIPGKSGMYCTEIITAPARLKENRAVLFPIVT
jgi:hypothetical protein